MNQQGGVNFDDLHWAIVTHLHTTFGDANLDGVFDSQDLVQVMHKRSEDTIANNSRVGPTEIGTATVASDALDLVVAFQYGGYQSDFLPAMIATAWRLRITTTSRPPRPRARQHPCPGRRPTWRSRRWRMRE